MRSSKKGIHATSGYPLVLSAMLYSMKSMYGSKNTSTKNSLIALRKSAILVSIMALPILVPEDNKNAGKCDLILEFIKRAIK